LKPTVAGSIPAGPTKRKASTNRGFSFGVGKAGIEENDPVPREFHATIWSIK
jgi:hypothetical protein